MQIEQFLGPDFVVTFGKLNAAGGVNIHPFLGSNRINRFMNEAFVLSPIYGRTIPCSPPAEPGGRRHQPAARLHRGLVGRGLLLPGDQQRPAGDPPARLADRHEQGLELYCNAAITSWFTLMADIQAIEPAQFGARSTFLFGLRAKIDF
jgi:hypothetical protein